MARTLVMRIAGIFLSVCLIPLQIQAQEGEWIAWEAETKLSWDDFQGEVLKTKNKAETHWRIYFDFQTSPLNQKLILSDYNIRTEFSKDKSWVKEGDGSEQLLNHEQGHFDLAEVYARKFRAQLDSLTFSSTNYQNEIEALFNNILAQCDETQNNYDIETEHGLRSKIQQDWQEYILKELNVLGNHPDSE